MSNERMMSTAQAAQVISGQLTAQFGFDGVVLTIRDRDGRYYVAAAMTDEPRTKVLADIATQIAGLVEKHDNGHPMTHVPHLSGPTHAACIHCRRTDVGLITDVEAIRHHSMTCPSSPVVQELAAAKQRIAQLEVELADALSDRAEVAPTWTPGPRVEG